MLVYLVNNIVENNMVVKRLFNVRACEVINFHNTSRRPFDVTVVFGDESWVMIKVKRDLLKF